MFCEPQHIFQSKDFQKSILNHLFLPVHLPSSDKEDYLTANHHSNEHHLLLYIKKFFKLLGSDSSLLIYGILQRCIDSWLKIQDINNSSVSRFRLTIEQLQTGDFLPVYFAAQNAAILIEIDGDPLKAPLISSWQVSLPASTISSSFESHLSTFPVSTFRLTSRTQLTSPIHCELLTDLMSNTVEHLKTTKNSHDFDEIRDVPISHYVCQWWIQQLQSIYQEKQSYSFKKKHRDQVRWKKSMLPFRRSGLWMTIKVVFQSILSKRLSKHGEIIYKLLITQFLTYILYEQTTLMNMQISRDVLIHGIQKISRRLHKIENLCFSMIKDHLSSWLEQIVEKIMQQIRSLISYCHWPNLFPIHEENQQSLEEIRTLLNQPDVYQHSFFKLKYYLLRENPNHVSINPPNTSQFIFVNHYDGVQIPSFSMLINQAKYTTEIALTRMEIWVETQLERWLVNSLPLDNLEKLLRFFEDYQQSALNNYDSNPFGYSRYILTSLTIIHQMHQALCNDPRFERLELHQIQIPSLFDLFEYLVLPTQDQMIRAHVLYEYFYQFSLKTHPDLLKNIDSPNAFGVYFAGRSTFMIQTFNKIQAQVEKDRMNKVQEVIKAHRKYEELIQKAQLYECECSVEGQPKKCNRCPLIRQANDLKVSIYECPIPSKREKALAPM